MLESIYIENFAIIDRLEVDFHNHMTYGRNWSRKINYY